MSDTTKLLHDLGAVVTLVADDLEDEGDRVYLGSTNHKELLAKVRQRYFEWRWLNNDAGDENTLADLEDAP